MNQRVRKTPSVVGMLVAFANYRHPASADICVILAGAICGVGPTAGIVKELRMAAALRKPGFTLNGTHCQEIDDATNIVRLLPCVVDLTR